jgi:SAM-dependent methyltransferase
MPRLLNLGCGPRFCDDPNWTNLDFVSLADSVIAHDLNRGLPFQDESFDAVYHSNVLEHFAPSDGGRLIGECFRVLKPRGILRVVVPDLEMICRSYLEALSHLESGDESWHGKYDWLRLVMFDQAVRTKPGGAMGDYLRQPQLRDKEFLAGFGGSIAREAIEAAGDLPDDTEVSPTISFWKRASYKYRYERARIARGIRTALLDRHEKEALKLGLFRLSGEIHQWMYDSYSLRSLLEEIGFVEVRRCLSTESAIPQWNDYFLDFDPDGFEHAPGGVYMEGVKP